MSKEAIICIVITLAFLSVGDDIRRNNVLLEQISKDIRESKNNG